MTSQYVPLETVQKAVQLASRAIHMDKVHQHMTQLQRHYLAQAVAMMRIEDPRKRKPPYRDLIQQAFVNSMYNSTSLWEQARTFHVRYNERDGCFIER